MEPTEALAAIERTLRGVVSSLKPDWQAGMDPKAVARMERAREAEAQARDGAVPSADLLEFTYTNTLIELVLSDYDQFEPVLGDIERTRGLLRVVEDTRNTIAHARGVLPFERDLLSGIAGRLRNQVAMWRSQADSPSRYYPLIERVTDQAGSVGARLGGSSYTYGLSAIQRLDVGDQLRFQASAVGAREFPVTWHLSKGNSVPTVGSMYFPPTIAVGDDVEIVHTLTSADVGEHEIFLLILSSESKHHRHDRLWDDARAFAYSVNPPEDE